MFRGRSQSQKVTCDPIRVEIQPRKRQRQKVDSGLLRAGQGTGGCGVTAEGYRVLGGFLK